MGSLVVLVLNIKSSLLLEVMMSFLVSYYPQPFALLGLSVVFSTLNQRGRSPDCLVIYISVVRLPQIEHIRSLRSFFK
jgi:hypothetical protein